MQSLIPPAGTKTVSPLCYEVKPSDPSEDSDMLHSCKARAASRPILGSLSQLVSLCPLILASSALGLFPARS